MTVPTLDPESLAARMADELERNPAAKPILLRSILTDDFLLLPAKVDRLMDLLERVDRLEAGQARMEARQARLEGRFSNYEGSDYERRVRSRAISRARHQLGLQTPYVAMTQDAQNAPEFNRAITRALASGAITEEESAALHETDLIIFDEDSDQCVAIEVSLTADNRDISRALERSRILGAVTNGRCHPAVITALLDEPQRLIAAAQGVAVFVIPYPLR